MEQNPLPDEVFNRIREFFYERTGNAIPETKKYLILHRLSSLIGKDKKYKSFEDLCCRVISDPDGDEAFKVITLLTTHYSYFFREREHFIFLQEYLMGRKKKEETRIWSAASSTGEEAYSAAICAKLAVPDIDGSRLKILGTDIARDSLRKAQKGAFNLPLLKEHISADIIDEFFSVEGGLALIHDNIKEMTRFRYLNLLDPYPFQKLFHIVFLRNILYYLDNEKRDILVRHIVDYVEKGGYLIFGYMDSVSTRSLPLAPVRNNIYRKL